MEILIFDYRKSAEKKVENNYVYVYTKQFLEIKNKF